MQVETFLFSEDNMIKKADKMTLFFQTLTSAGVVSNDLKEVTSVTSDHYEFVDFDIYPNPAQTKFIIKSSHNRIKKQITVLILF